MAPMAASKVEKMEVDEEKKSVKEEPPVDINSITLESLKEQCVQLDKGETHILGRLLQSIPKTRKLLNKEVLNKLLTWQQPTATGNRDQVLTWVPYTPAATAVVPMEVDVGSQKAAKSPRPARRTATVANTSPESELYAHLLVLLHLVDLKEKELAAVAASLLVERVDGFERRSLDPIAARAFFYQALIHEWNGTLDAQRSYLNARLRTSTLRHETHSQAVLINALLRAYLLGKHFQSAARLISKVTFPDGANNNDLARFFYYQGRIKAMQLDYSSAAGFFQQAMRKAPQDAAIGFKQHVQKWVVVISLLQGVIPERSIFRAPIHRICLAPYLELTHAVRLGDLPKFSSVMEEKAKAFEADETLTLIVRLRQNVIKTAIRQISLAYSRIYLRDICRKLQLANEQEAEYLVAKAIAEGSIEATITSDTKEGDLYMQSSETADVYRTAEPQNHFDSRIKYCLELHNQAVKALRFPPKKDAVPLETVEQQRLREQQELEFAKEMADEDDDDF